MQAFVSLFSKPCEANGLTKRSDKGEKFFQKSFHGLIFTPLPPCQCRLIDSLAWFDFKLPDNLPDAKSLIVVAIPQPQLRVVFNWNQKTRSIIIPPTYLHYPNEEIENILKGILEPQRFRVARTALPLKLLAVRSGLGSYGKNNICYVSGMGSFHRLMAFYTDFACSEDTWQEA